MSWGIPDEDEDGKLIEHEAKPDDGRARAIE